MPTKENVNAALDAWRLAHNRMVHENQTFALLLQNRDSLIRSLVSIQGWNAAQAEFQRHVDAHQKALQEAMKSEGVAAQAYLDTKRQFEADTAS